MCEFPSNRARIARHLKYDGIDTLGKLIDATHARLRGVRALGSISLRSINDFLASIGERRKEPGKDGEGRLSADDIRDAMSSDGVSPTLRSSIFDAISAERSRQDEEHGQTLAIDRIPAVLGEEYGEVCRSLNDKEPMRRLVAELVQCAAVCVKAIESIDRAGMRVLRVDEESAMRAGTVTHDPTKEVGQTDRIYCGTYFVKGGDE